LHYKLVKDDAIVRYWEVDQALWGELFDHRHYEEIRI